MYFRYFPRYGDFPVLAEVLNELGQCLDQPERRFINYHGPAFRRKFFQSCLPPFLLGQEALETETVVWQSRVDQRRNKSGSAGQTFHVDPSPDALADKQEARIRNSGRTGIGNQCDVLASQTRSAISSTVWCSLNLWCERIGFCMSKCLRSTLVVRVSSAKMRSASFRALMPRKVMSSKFPIGVGTTTSFAILFYINVGL